MFCLNFFLCKKNYYRCTFLLGGIVCIHISLAYSHIFMGITVHEMNNSYIDIVITLKDHYFLLFIFLTCKMLIKLN